MLRCPSWCPKTSRLASARWPRSSPACAPMSPSWWIALRRTGLVKRIDDPADRRAVRAEVTALGRERHAAGTRVVNAVLEDVAKELSAVDSQVLKRALDAVR